jgi:phosphoribosyl-ATP pyrophosphohydrolase/phosphoribosyl-AMP cyclohydrolase
MSEDPAEKRGELDFLIALEEIIEERLASRPADSYVAKLAAAGERRLAQKLGEEAIELALAAAAGSKEEQREEAADLVFHLLVLLKAQGIRLADIAGILEQRHKAR